MLEGGWGSLKENRLPFGKKGTQKQLLQTRDTTKTKRMVKTFTRFRGIPGPQTFVFRSHLTLFKDKRQDGLERQLSHSCPG